jgi:predicted AlkP superfamily phosphohydrolase/phosphomutase
MVDRIVRTRKDASDRNPKLPDPDLIIVWQEEFVTDVMDSPEYGRFGPMPPYRAGSHRANGFMLAVGPDIQPGSTVENGHALDIAPTILALMGAPIADHMEGKPVFMPQKEMASTAS